MDFGDTRRAGAVLDRVSRREPGRVREGAVVQGHQQQAPAVRRSGGAVITTNSISTFFTPQADQVLRSDRASS